MRMAMKQGFPMGHILHALILFAFILTIAVFSPKAFASDGRPDLAVANAVRLNKGNAAALAKALSAIERKEGAQVFTLAVVQTLIDAPDMTEAFVKAADAPASANFVLALSVAISQAIVTIAETDPAIAAGMKSVVDRQASAALKQQVATNLTNSTLSTATTK